MDYLNEFQRNPERGAALLVSEYGDRLFEVAKRICLNIYDAEDLVFRTFAQAIRKIGSFRQKSSFYTWLYAIMMNFYRMDLRLKSANALLFQAELPEIEDTALDPGEVLAKEVDAELLRMIVSRLPERLREVVIFRYFEDLSMSEIAKILDIPVGTVRFRLFTARNEIRRRLMQTKTDGEASKGMERF